MSRLKKTILKLMERFYVAHKMLYRRRLRKKYPKSRKKILIYTMGKVGSTSIYESLLGHYKTHNCIHLHRLSNEYLTEREQLMKRDVFPNKKNFSEHLFTDLLWKPQWVKTNFFNEDSELSVITVIREPISRNISLFFQWMEFREHEDQYEFKSRHRKYPYHITTPKDDISALYKIFFEEFDANTHLEWIETEFNQVLGIDLLAHEFDKAMGYSIIKKPNLRALVLKLEEMDHVLKEAIVEFLGLEIEVSSANKADAKKIKNVYKMFKDNIEIPQSYINALYDAPYMRHFYGDSQIELFKQNWKN